MTSSKNHDGPDSLRDVAEEFASRVEMAAESLADHVEDAADELSERLGHASDETFAARFRMKQQLSRVAEAFRDFSKDAERPATRVARALDDLSYEAKRSFDKITSRPRPSFLSRLAFWR